MRVWCLVVLLSLMAAAEPRVTRAHGSYTGGRVVPIRGQNWRGQVEFSPVKDLRDCQVINLRIHLANRGKQPACLAVYVALLDARGELLAAEGYEESVFLKEPGATLEHRIDLAIPQTVQNKIATYRVTLVEDTQRLK
ncbi:MAG: hypothetical protein AB7S38_31275 [Vulcanimicrobiota bacterium]